jgi:hypothetical protein
MKVNGQASSRFYPGIYLEGLRKTFKTSVRIDRSLKHNLQITLFSKNL